MYIVVKIYVAFSKSWYCYNFGPSRLSCHGIGLVNIFHCPMFCQFFELYVAACLRFAYLRASIQLFTSCCFALHILFTLSLVLYFVYILLFSLFILLLVWEQVKALKFLTKYRCSISATVLIFVPYQWWITTISDTTQKLYHTNMYQNLIIYYMHMMIFTLAHIGMKYLKKK